MNATSAKNAAKKFQIEDDFYIVKTHPAGIELLKGNFTAWARPMAFEFTYWLNFKISWAPAFPHIPRIAVD